MQISRWAHCRCQVVFLCVLFQRIMGGEVAEKPILQVLVSISHYSLQHLRLGNMHYFSSPNMLQLHCISMIIDWISTSNQWLSGLGSPSLFSRPRGPRTANLVSSCCPHPRGTLFHNVLVLVLKDKWNSCVLMRTTYEDFIGLCYLWLFFSIEDSPVPLFMTLKYPWCQIHT